MSERMYYDGPLAVRKSEWTGDWWILEKDEHDGERGIRWEGNAGSVFDSARVSNADVEGAGDEMRALAAAILAGGEASFRRCAVRPDGEHYLLWSPRNSIAEGMVPRARAEDLARLILTTVPEPATAP